MRNHSLRRKSKQTYKAKEAGRPHQGSGGVVRAREVRLQRGGGSPAPRASPWPRSPRPRRSRQAARVHSGERQRALRDKVDVLQAAGAGPQAERLRPHAAADLRGE